jgi:hypothetical protein
MNTWRLATDLALRHRTDAENGGWGRTRNERIIRSRIAVRAVSRGSQMPVVVFLALAIGLLSIFWASNATAGVWGVGFACFPPQLTTITA